MIGNLLFALVGLALSAFMINRLYVGIGENELNVKGVTYSRSSTPIAYWLTLLMALFGFCFGLLITLAGIMLAFQ